MKCFILFPSKSPKGALTDKEYVFFQFFICCLNITKRCEPGASGIMLLMLAFSVYYVKKSKTAGSGKIQGRGQGMIICFLQIQNFFDVCEGWQKFGIFLFKTNNIIQETKNNIMQSKTKLLRENIIRLAFIFILYYDRKQNQDIGLC